MFLISETDITSYNVPESEAESLLKKNAYDYACFLYSDPLIRLFPAVERRKVRLLNDMAHDYTLLPEVPTVILHGSPKTLAMSKGLPLTSLCRIGFPPSQRAWKESRSPKELCQKYASLAKFQGRVLFYGRVDPQWHNDVRPEIRQRQISLCKSAGLTPVVAQVDPSPARKLLDILEENKCFAALGLDGDCFSCFRDAEQALACVPVIRITSQMEAQGLVNPWGCSWTVGEDEPDPVGSIRAAAREMLSECRSGGISIRLCNGMDVAFRAHERPYFFAILNSLCMDSQFAVDLVKNGLDESEASLVKAAVEISGSVEKRIAWVPERFEAFDWHGEKLRNKVFVGTPGTVIPGQPYLGHLGASLEAASTSCQCPSPKLSFVIPCMGRLDSLKKTTPYLLNQPETEIVLVDWSCPQNCGDWASKYEGISVVRVPGQEHFNLSKARNAGARQAKGDWLCFIDGDVIVRPNFSAEILKLAAEGKYVTFGTTLEMGLSGMTLCSRKDFESIRGYDEKLEGWGWEDSDFKMRLSKPGLTEVGLNAELALHIPHGDAERVMFYSQKDKKESNSKNRGMSQSQRADEPESRVLSPQEKDLVGAYSAWHVSWEGMIHLAEDGSFTGGSEKPNGKWRFKEGNLVLDWTFWPPEQLKSISPVMLKGKTMTMEKVEGAYDPNAVWFHTGGGLGDRLCILSALREWARQHPDKKVRFSDSIIRGIMEAYGDSLVQYGMGGGGEGLVCTNIRHRGRNWLEPFMLSVGLAPAELPSLDLPKVDPWLGLEPKTYVVLQPKAGAQGNISRDQLLVLVECCRRMRQKVVVVGSDNPSSSWDTTARDMDLPWVEYHLGKPLKMLRIICHAKCVLTPSSASAHIAAAYRIPTVIWLDGCEQHTSYPNWRRKTIPLSYDFSRISEAINEVLYKNEMLCSGNREKELAGTYSVRHASWEGMIRLSENGTLTGGNGDPSRGWRIGEGKWRVEEDSVIIDWASCPQERVKQISPILLKGETMTMEKDDQAYDPEAVTVTGGDGLGDKVCRISALRAWARAHPDKKVRLTDFSIKDIVEAYGDNLVQYGMGGGENLVCRVFQEGRSWLDSFYASVGLTPAAPPSPDLPKVYPWPGLDPKTYVVLQPKAWAGSNILRDQLLALIECCRKMGQKVVVVGSSSWGMDMDLPWVEYHLGKPLKMLRIICHAKCVLTPRSASAHIAAAYRVPTVVWLHGGEQHIAYPNWNHKIIPLTYDFSRISEAINEVLGFPFEEVRSLSYSERHSDPSVIGRWEAKHTHWSGWMEFMADGKIAGSSQNSSGTWSFDGNRLDIRWDEWPVETLYFNGSEFIGNENFKSLRRASKRIERIKSLVRLRQFSDEDKAEQIRHIKEEDWLYQVGRKRYICSLLGTIFEECKDDAVKDLVLECVWMARRMHDTCKSQDKMWDEDGITVGFAGRIGNNMFQYSYARCLAEQTNVPYLFCIPPELRNFNLKEVSEQRRESYSPPPLGHPYYQTYANLDVLLDNREKVRSWFPFSEDGMKLLDSFGNPPVFHVRGGDYQNQGWQIDAEYYRRAAEICLNPLIVTDDIPYSRELLKGIKYTDIISTDTDFSTLCHSKILVCSNSTYCWWAAFLGNHEQVYSPDGWQKSGRSTPFSWPGGMELGWKKIIR